MLLSQESHVNHVKKSTLSEPLPVNVAQASFEVRSQASSNSPNKNVQFYVYHGACGGSNRGCGGGSNRGCGGHSDGCSRLSAKFAMSLVVKRV